MKEKGIRFALICFKILNTVRNNIKKFYESAVGVALTSGYYFVLQEYSTYMV